MWAMERADLTPGQRRMLAAQRARKWSKFHRWAEEMRQYGWIAFPPPDGAMVPTTWTTSTGHSVTITYDYGSTLPH